MMLNERDILIIVDMQVDFLPGGALAVPEGDAIVAPLNRLARRFAHVALTQDWHPAGHVSFASRHAMAVGESISLPDGRTQLLWPDHCLQASPGAAITAALDVPHAELVIRKGYRRDLDSYSAFLEADGVTGTGLAGYLRERALKRVFVAGLATDFCAGWTAIDAARAGFETLLVDDVVRGIDVAGSMARAQADMAAAGVTRTVSADVEEASAASRGRRADA